MIKPSQVAAFNFGVQNPLTAAAVNADSTPTCVVYKNGTVDGAVTPTVTNPATGHYKVTFTVPVSYVEGDSVEALVVAIVNAITSPPTSVYFERVTAKFVSELNDLDSTDITNAVPTVGDIAAAVPDVTDITNAVPTATEIADETLKRDWNAVVGAAARSLLNAGRKLRNRVAFDGVNTLTVYEEDDATPAYTQPVATDPAQEPFESVG